MKGWCIMKVSIFATCLTNALYPDVDLTMAKILKHLGHTINVPEGQACCGQIAFNSGYMDDAREVARTLINSFERSEIVVAPSVRSRRSPFKTPFSCSRLGASSLTRSPPLLWLWWDILSKNAQNL